MKKMYVSKKAIMKYGYDYFKNFSFNNYYDIADQELKELDDGLLIIANSEINDPDKDIFVFADETDINFATYYNIEKIRLEIELVYYSQFFSMKRVCETSDVSYQTYRNFKNNCAPLSTNKIKTLLNTMIKISNNLNNELIQLNPSTFYYNELFPEHIAIHHNYRFGQLCNGDGDIGELLNSGSVSIWNDRIKDSQNIDFIVAIEDKEDSLNTIVRITDII